MNPGPVNLDWSVILSGGTLLAAVANVVYTLFVSRRLDRIDGLEKSLKEATSELIDEKLAAVRQEQQACDRTKTREIEDIRRRLDQGDGRFAHLDEKRHELEVQLLRALNELKEKVVTKDDLDRWLKESDRG